MSELRQALGTYEKEERRRDGGEQKVVSVRGPNRNLLMGVASPQREKSCVVASSTDAPTAPSLLLERGRELVILARWMEKM